uniref:Uncharacterized protein n=1 Tax=Oryza brachyantha TaxID=4533 RepID=J3N7E4_ORYBR
MDSLECHYVNGLRPSNSCPVCYFIILAVNFILVHCFSNMPLPTYCLHMCHTYAIYSKNFCIVQEAHKVDTLRFFLIVHDGIFYFFYLSHAYFFLHSHCIFFIY